MPFICPQDPSTRKLPWAFYCHSLHDPSKCTSSTRYLSSLSFSRQVISSITNFSTSQTNIPFQSFISPALAGSPSYHIQSEISRSNPPLFLSAATSIRRSPPPLAVTWMPGSPPPPLTSPVMFLEATVAPASTTTQSVRSKRS